MPFDASNLRQFIDRITRGPTPHRLAEHTSSARVFGAEGQDGGRRAQGAVRLGAVEAAREAEHLATRIEQLRSKSVSQ